MINTLKKSFKGSPFCLWLWNEKRRMQGEKNYKHISDIAAISQTYKSVCNREVNWKNPERFTEKLQWLKLFYRDPLIPVCSDKYEVREYLEKLGYGNYLNELIDVYENVDDIDISQLPDRFVLKAAHGSGWNMIVRDKTKINWFMWKLVMCSWLKQNLAWYGREWNYESQKPRIIVEKYLEDDSGELRDYKIFCFNGEPYFAQLDEGRFSDHNRIYVDIHGVPLPMYDVHVHGCEKPKFLSPFPQMVELARELAKPFPHVRVDFYSCNDKIYFGEMTFFDGSGYYNLTPDSWDFHWGEKLNLPKPNYNLDLYNDLMQK